MLVSGKIVVIINLESADYATERFGKRSRKIVLSSVGENASAVYIQSGNDYISRVSAAVMIGIPDSVRSRVGQSGLNYEFFALEVLSRKVFAHFYDFSARLVPHNGGTCGNVVRNARMVGAQRNRFISTHAHRIGDDFRQNLVVAYLGQLEFFQP